MGLPLDAGGKLTSHRRRHQKCRERNDVLRIPNCKGTDWRKKKEVVTEHPGDGGDNRFGEAPATGDEKHGDEVGESSGGLIHSRIVTGGGDGANRENRRHQLSGRRPGRFTHIWHYLHSRAEREERLRAQTRPRSFPPIHHRYTATADHTASTNPNGHAPCRNPYADPRTHDPAKASVNQRLRCSS